MPIAIKVFQDTAITNAVEFLDAACQQLASISDKAGKRKIISHNGCLLIEAPTGAGKTLIAGHTAERFSHGKKIVWFWFAPFAGLVEQSIRTIKNEFPGLTVKDPRKERSVDSVKAEMFSSPPGAQLPPIMQKAAKLAPGLTQHFLSTNWFRP